MRVSSILTGIFALTAFGVAISAGGIKHGPTQKGYLDLAHNFRDSFITHLDVYWAPTPMGKLVTGKPYPHNSAHALENMLPGSAEPKMPNANEPYHSDAFLGIDSGDGSTIYIRLERSGSLRGTGIPRHKPHDAKRKAKKVKKKGKGLVHRVAASAREFRYGTAVPVREFLHNMAIIALARHGEPADPTPRTLQKIIAASGGDETLQRDLTILLDARWQNFDPRTQNCQHESWYIMRALMPGPPLAEEDGTLCLGSVEQHGRHYTVGAFRQDMDKMLDCGLPKVAKWVKALNTKIRPAGKASVAPTQARTLQLAPPVQSPNHRRAAER